MNAFRGGPGQVGPFELDRQIANTATGAVWQGHDPALHRVVALKRVSDHAVQSVDGLRREARLLAALPHPNIVRVIDLIETPGQLWLIEEWIDGVALPSVVERVGRMTPEQSVGVARGALLGLAFAHENGVVHGDVSPSNVLLDRDGTTKLIDFGLAGPTGTPGVSGTPGYLSPEAAHGRPLLPASDVYSSAALLAYLLRGRPVFEGPTAEAVIAAQVTSGQPDLRGIHGAIGDVLRRSLAADMTVRPADAGEFLAALDDAAERTFGAGWLAGAGLAGAVAATMTATLATTAGPATAALTAGAAGAGPAGAAKAAATRSVLRPALASVKSQVIMAASAVAVVAAVVGAVLLATHHGSTPTARAGTPVGLSPNATPISFNLATFDWRNARVPGNSCFDPAPIALHDGTAALTAPAPAPAPGGAATHLTLRLIGAPAFGALSAGPHVAVLALECGWGGYFGGVGQAAVTYAVYDAQQPAPHLIGLFADPGVAFGKHGVAVRNGAIDVTYSEYEPTDGRCCPSGPPKTAVISYQAGTLVASWPRTSPRTTPGGQGSPTATQVAAPATTGTPSTPGTGSRTAGSSSEPGFPRAVRLRTWSETSGPTGSIPATLEAEDRIAGCATHSYGAAIIDYFRRHPCHSATRRLYTIVYRGRTVALSWITVVPDPGTRVPQDGLDNAATFDRLENAENTGGIDDLLREGRRPAGWPAAIPSDETFVTGGHGGEVDVVEVFDAWYLQGGNVSQDPSLKALIRSLYFTS